jgi:hypothetical protein
MSDPAVRLDRTRPYSTVHGDRQPDDPHYLVHFWQGEKVDRRPDDRLYRDPKAGKVMVLLPFGAEGELVPDDKRTEPYPGTVQGDKGPVPVMHQPLYTQAMRELLEKKKRRLAAKAAEPETDQEDDDPPAELTTNVVELDNILKSWLRGEEKYRPDFIRTVAKKRFGRAFSAVRQMVEDLVIDEKLVPEEEVCVALAGHLPPKAA